MGLVRNLVMLVTLLGSIMPVTAADITFSGLVAYRERMALPAGSSLSIALVRLPEGQRVAGAQAGLGDKVGSPIGFTLNVRSNLLAADGAYGLLAEIRHEGRSLFANRQPVMVEPQAPSNITIAVEFSPPGPPDTAASSGQPVVAPNPLLDIVWVVTSIGGDPVLAGSQLTFSIAADHRVGGRGGCNSYFTEASFGAPSLGFGPIAGTRMACDPALMAQEARFFAALAATASYDFSGNALKLADAAGIPLIGLVRQP